MTKIYHGTTKWCDKIQDFDWNTVNPPKSVWTESRQLEGKNYLPFD